MPIQGEYHDWTPGIVEPARISRPDGLVHIIRGPYGQRKSYCGLSTIGKPIWVAPEPPEDIQCSRCWKLFKDDQTLYLKAMAKPPGLVGRKKKVRGVKRKESKQEKKAVA